MDDEIHLFIMYGLVFANFLYFHLEKQELLLDFARRKFDYKIDLCLVYKIYIIDIRYIK